MMLAGRLRVSQTFRIASCMNEIHVNICNSVHREITLIQLASYHNYCHRISNVLCCVHTWLV